MSGYALVLALLAGTAGHADEPPTAGAERASGMVHELSGAWRLDPGRSEDAREKMRAQLDRRRGDREGRPSGGRGGMGGGRGGRVGGLGGHGAGGREGANPESLREALDELLEAPESMAVTARAMEVEIVHKDGRVRRLRPDGRKVRHDGAWETRARWDDGGLVSETWLGGGMAHAVETWALDPKKRELVSTLRIENRRSGGEPVTATRVYVPQVPTE